MKFRFTLRLVGRFSVVRYQLRCPTSGAASEVTYDHNSEQQKQEPELEKGQGKERNGRDKEISVGISRTW